jgi:adenosylcobinamide-GDP ribazoletransferase
VKAILASIAEAFAYFSVLPLPEAYSRNAPPPRALSALPLVGAVIGALAGAFGYGIAVVSSPLFGYAAALTAIVVLSGAIHLDGFLDSCDALFTAATPQRRLEILKDPRHGTYAVVGMAISTVWWLAALSVTRPQDLPARLAFACALSRAASVVPAFIYRYARETPSSALGTAPGWIAIVALLAALAAVSKFFSPLAWITVPASVLAALLIARWISARLGGGLVGDSYGFLITILEPLLLSASGV